MTMTPAEFRRRAEKLARRGPPGKRQPGGDWATRVGLALGYSRVHVYDMLASRKPISPRAELLIRALTD